MFAVKACRSCGCIIPQLKAWPTVFAPVGDSSFRPGLRRLPLVPDMDQICVFNPAKTLSRFITPAVLMESVVADGKNISFTPDEPLRCASGTRRFEFHYSAIDLLKSQALRFQYKLEGMDRNWG